MKEENISKIKKGKGPLNEVGGSALLAAAQESAAGERRNEDGELCKMSRSGPKSHRVPELPPGSVHIKKK